MAKVLVAMSGGVDSSVAAAILRDQGHECVGVTLKLWGGPSDSGCCSVSDVEDARRVASQLGIKHVVFNFSEAFEADVVTPYVEAYARGETPNPCIECNRSIKFAVLLERAKRLGFDYVATGHHARIGHGEEGPVLLRGVDREKDQSYVLSMLTSAQLSMLMLPIGEMRKSEVRARASELGLRTANKPDSLEVCFISKAEGRDAFLGKRIPLRRARAVDLVDGSARELDVNFETVTVGQRKGIGSMGDSRKRFVVDKDASTGTIVLGSERDLVRSTQRVREIVCHEVDLSDVEVQTAAHGSTLRGSLDGEQVVFSSPRRRVAPGQTLAFYRGDRVVGSAIVAD